MPGIGLAPEDFVVDEIPLYQPSGEGNHTFLRVEKRLRNSEGVQRELARLAGVRPAEVGYAGRKDRVAIARQWFSVPGLDPERALALESGSGAPGVHFPSGPKRRARNPWERGSCGSPSGCRREATPPCSSSGCSAWEVPGSDDRGPYLAYSSLSRVLGA